MQMPSTGNNLPEAGKKASMGEIRYVGFVKKKSKNHCPDMQSDEKRSIRPLSIDEPVIIR